MRLIVESLTTSSLPRAWPEGVNVLRQLDDASALVDATPSGERALRALPRLTVRREATLSLDPVDEGARIDVIDALRQARERRAALGWPDTGLPGTTGSSGSA